jgi:hypothetical protein
LASSTSEASQVSDTVKWARGINLACVNRGQLEGFEPDYEEEYQEYSLAPRKEAVGKEPQRIFL